MKNRFFIILVILALAACDPIEERDSIGGAITADELIVSATPIIVDGKNGNMVILENKSPVSSNWLCGSTTSTSAYDTVMVVATGTIGVRFTGLNPDGTTIIKEFTISIDTLSTLPDEFKLLFGDPTQGITSKKYVWDETAGGVWGNGGYLGSRKPEWWVNDKASMDSNDPDYGSDAFMVFDLNGMKLTKTSENGSRSETGTVNLDITAKKTGADNNPWSIAKITTSGVTVLCGRAPNHGNAPVYEYDVIELTDDQLILAWPEPGAAAWGTAWFWVFRAVNE